MEKEQVNGRGTSRRGSLPSVRFPQLTRLSPAYGARSVGTMMATRPAVGNVNIGTISGWGYRQPPSRAAVDIALFGQPVVLTARLCSIPGPTATLWSNTTSQNPLDLTISAPTRPLRGKTMLHCPANLWPKSQLGSALFVHAPLRAGGHGNPPVLPAAKQQEGKRSAASF
jgi:hypothetical protein